MLNKILKERRSPVLFSDELIDENDLRSIFEAARWAPSSNNQQPWRFIVAAKDDSEEFERLFNCLNENNKIWVKKVPVLCLTIQETISDYNYKENKYAKHDVGLSTACMIFQAMSLGIFAHIMGGYNSDMAIRMLSIPERFSPVAMIAFGYPAKSKSGFDSVLIEKESRPRKRKSISEIVYHGKWGVNMNFGY